MPMDVLTLIRELLAPFRSPIIVGLIVLTATIQLLRLLMAFAIAVYPAVHRCEDNQRGWEHFTQASDWAHSFQRGHYEMFDNYPSFWRRFRAAYAHHTDLVYVYGQWFMISTSP